MKPFVTLLLISSLLTSCKKDPKVEPAVYYNVKYYVKGNGSMAIDTIQYVNERGQLQTLTQVNSFSKEFRTQNNISAMLRVKGIIFSGSCKFEYEVTGPKTDTSHKVLNFSGPGSYSFDVKKSTHF